jgi:hypothetical protein
MHVKACTAIDSSIFKARSVQSYFMPRHAGFTYDNRTNNDWGFEYLWLEKVIWY